MSETKQNSFFKPAGRETRRRFWPVFLPYLLVYCAGCALLLADALISLAVLSVCLVWVTLLSGHIIRRLHDAGVSAFFCWLVPIMWLLFYLLLGIDMSHYPDAPSGSGTLYTLECLIGGAIIPVLHVAIIVFCCLPTEAGANAYGPSEAHPGATFTGTSWGGIIEDMLKLMVAMGILGGICNLAMKPFETINATDSLVSLIRKGGVSDGKDPIFAAELKQGMDKVADFVNTKDNTGRTPLMWAVYSNFNDPDKSQELDLVRVFYVKELLKAPGIRPQETDKDGFTALHWATWSGMPVCSVELVAAGLDINAQEGNGYTPLMLAAMRGNDVTVETLLKLGADAAVKNADGKTALDLVTQSEGAYKKRDDWKYTLIFSANREKAYTRTISLLQNPPAPSSLESLQAEGQSKVEAAEKEKQKEKGEGASVAPEEKAMEHSVDAAAAAPAETSPEQAPSLDPQPLDETPAAEGK